LLRRRKRKEKRNAITLPARGRTRGAPARGRKEAPDGTGGTVAAVAAREGEEEERLEGTAGEESGF
jgi:hypothetical protein